MPNEAAIPMLECYARLECERGTKRQRMDRFVIHRYIVVHAVYCAPCPIHNRVKCFDLFYHFLEFIWFRGGGIYFSLFFNGNASQFQLAWDEFGIFIIRWKSRKSKAINISERRFTYCEWLERTVVIRSTAERYCVFISLKIFSLSVLCLAFAPIRSSSRAVQQRAHIFRRHSTQKKSDPIRSTYDARVYLFIVKKCYSAGFVCVFFILFLFVFSCCASHKRPTCGIVTVHVPCSSGMGLCMRLESLFHRVLHASTMFFPLGSSSSFLNWLRRMEKSCKCFARTRRGQSECEMTSQRMDS